MRFYLLRHADAVPEDQDLPDIFRYLSVSGRAMARAIGQKLSELGVNVERIYSSPLVRAVQTAELVATAGTLVIALPPLSPRGSVEHAADVISQCGVDVIVVGHEPNLSSLGAVLVGADRVAMLQTAEVVLIEERRVRWRLPAGAVSPQPVDD